MTMESLRLPVNDDVYVLHQFCEEQLERVYIHVVLHDSCSNPLGLRLISYLPTSLQTGTRIIGGGR